MKQIIFITTLFLFVSCGQGNDERSKKKSGDLNKESFSQTNVKNKKESTIEAKVNEDNNPVDIALTFINSYVVDSNKMNKSVGYIAFVNSSSLTTNDFKTELKNIIDKANKEDPEMGLDFDPIVDGNDLPDEGFELESYDKKSNFIIVKGKNWTDFKVTMKVVLEDNKWFVDGCGIINIPKEEQSKR